MYEREPRSARTVAGTPSERLSYRQIPRKPSSAAKLRFDDKSTMTCMPTCRPFARHLPQSTALSHSPSRNRGRTNAEQYTVQSPPQDHKRANSSTCGSGSEDAIRPSDSMQTAHTRPGTRSSTATWPPNRRTGCSPIRHHQCPNRAKRPDSTGRRPAGIRAQPRADDRE